MVTLAEELFGVNGLVPLRQTEELLRVNGWH